MNLDDTPTGAIARLDASLVKRGEAIVLRRRVGTTNVWNEVTLRGKLSGYTASELVGSTKQTMQTFILSPTQLNAAVTAGTWPPTSGDFLVKINDELRGADGVNRKIVAIMAKRPSGVVVRYEGQVEG